MVTGARQVGKTTLLQHLVEMERAARRYVSLDEFGPRELAQNDPDLFLQRYPSPLVIDEIQHAPGLLQAIKPVVDWSGAMGAYWLTGSQHLPLMRDVSESLAGRVGIVHLHGLSTAESRQQEPATEPFRPDRATSETRSSDLLQTFERIVRGSYPRLVHPDAPDSESFYGSYLQTYIERDVRALNRIANMAAFRRFLTVTAARVGQLLNYSDISRDVGVAVSTIKEWISLLEATFQVYLLRPYYENIGKRQIKTPKLYFRDTGLMCYLTGWRSAETASSGAMAGLLFECHVVNEILKSYAHRGREAPVWFYRTKEKKEVDLLIAEDGKLFPVEVKLTARPRQRDLSGIAALQKTGVELGRGAVVCMVQNATPLSRDADAVPVDVLV